MSFQKVEYTAKHLKPRMKAAKSLDELPNIQGYRNVTVQVKADGEFSLIKYNREAGTCALNNFGRRTTGLPCLNELAELMAKWNIVEADILAELYAVDDRGVMLPLPKFIHILKGGNKKLWQNIRLGLFDLVSINGQPCSLIAPRKFEQMMGWIEGAKYVHVLEWWEVSMFKEIERFWKQTIDQGWEGIIVRLNGDTWKVKPNNGVDCAIIGINKNNKGFEEGKARSVKMALMNEDGSFVEIGDCSGVGEDEAKQLFELMEFKIGEDNHTVYVKPLVIATIEYIDTYSETRNRRYRIVDGRIREVGEQTLCRLKSPHIIGYRSDKIACIEDIGLNQVNEY